MIKTTGIEEKRIAAKNVCTSDLCLAAAEKLIAELKWDKIDLDVLVFVSQTPDYIFPFTSAILQDKLGLSKSCLCLDITLGCSGYVYGIFSIASLLSAGNVNKGLLLVGDTITKVVSPKDKSTKPLFGDAGTATAFEYNPNASKIDFQLGTERFFVFKNK